MTFHDLLHTFVLDAKGQYESDDIAKELMKMAKTMEVVAQADSSLAEGSPELSKKLHNGDMIGTYPNVMIAPREETEL